MAKLRRQRIVYPRWTTPRHVQDASAVLGLAEDRKDDVVVVLHPAETARQAPGVDDVADAVGLLTLDPAQEVEQEPGAAALPPGRTPEMQTLPKRGVDRGTVILCTCAFLRNLDGPGSCRPEMKPS